MGTDPHTAEVGPEAWAPQLPDAGPESRKSRIPPQYSPASQSNNWRNQVVPMDVDAGSMDDSRNVRKEPTHETRNMAKEQGQRGLSPLTEVERVELMAKRACFRCRKPGHMSRDCYSHRGPEMVNAGNMAPAPDRRIGRPAPRS